MKGENQHLMTDSPSARRVAEVESVKNATCINGKIVAEVEKLNASCFAALPDAKNMTTVRYSAVHSDLPTHLPPPRSSPPSLALKAGWRRQDGWIECFFNSLFGNRTTDSPALGGNWLRSLEDAAALRDKILGPPPPRPFNKLFRAFALRRTGLVNEIKNTLQYRHT
jgi:hypothetical protein